MIRRVVVMNMMHSCIVGKNTMEIKKKYETIKIYSIHPYMHFHVRCKPVVRGKRKNSFLHPLRSPSNWHRDGRDLHAAQSSATGRHGDVAPEKAVTFTSTEAPLALILHRHPLGGIRAADTGRWLGHSRRVRRAAPPGPGGTEMVLVGSNCDFCVHRKKKKKKV